MRASRPEVEHRRRGLLADEKESPVTDNGSRDDSMPPRYSEVRPSAASGVRAGRLAHLATEEERNLAGRGSSSARASRSARRPWPRPSVICTARFKPKPPLLSGSISALVAGSRDFAEPRRLLARDREVDDGGDRTHLLGEHVTRLAERARGDCQTVEDVLAGVAAIPPPRRSRHRRPRGPSSRGRSRSATSSGSSASVSCSTLRHDSHGCHGRLDGCCHDLVCPHARSGVSGPPPPRLASCAAPTGGLPRWCKREDGPEAQG